MAQGARVGFVGYFALLVRFLITQLEQHGAEGIDGGFGVDPKCFQLRGRAAFELPAQDVHQTHGIKTFAIAHDENLGAKTIRAPDESGGGPGMEAVFVRDHDLASDPHGLAFGAPTDHASGRAARAD